MFSRITTMAFRLCFWSLGSEKPRPEPCAVLWWRSFMMFVWLVYSWGERFHTPSLCAFLISKLIVCKAKGSNINLSSPAEHHSLKFEVSPSVIFCCCLCDAVITGHNNNCLLRFLRNIVLVVAYFCLRLIRFSQCCRSWMDLEKMFNMFIT